MIAETARRVTENIKKVIVGRDEVIELALVALLAELPARRMGSFQ